MLAISYYKYQIEHNEEQVKILGTRYWFTTRKQVEKILLTYQNFQAFVLNNRFITKTSQTSDENCLISTQNYSKRINNDNNRNLKVNHLSQFQMFIILHSKREK